MLNVRCPKCGKELAAPDELVGKMAACPRCSTQFPVTVNVRASAPSLLSPANPGSTPTAPVASPPPPAPMAGPPGNPLTVASVASNLPPVPVATPIPPPPPPRTIPESRTTGVTPAAEPPSVSSRSNVPSASNAPPTASTPADPNQSAAGTLRTGQSSPGMKSVSRPASTTLPAPSSGSAAPREAAPARFIAASPGDTRINLGADGRLPELKLDEGTKKDEEQETERTTHPLLLATVLALSLGSMILMWLWDTEATRSETAAKQEARQQLLDHYTNRPFERYQQLLRKALQAHNQGKYADERRYYRQVLNLLRDERLDKEKSLTGLTGVRKGSGPVSDEHLESLLARLLSEG